MLKNFSFLFLCVGAIATFFSVINGADESPPTQPVIKDAETFKKLLQMKHAEVVSAVKNIKKLGDNLNQYKMISIVLKNILEVFTGTRATLESNGYIPGSGWPEEDATREALALTIENSVLFGEIVLRFPHITQQLLQENREGSLVAKWNVGFTKDSGLLGGKQNELLHLLSQELGIIPKEPNYVNPYLKGKKDDFQAELPTQTKSKKKKEKKPKGPRLSRTEL